MPFKTFIDGQVLTGADVMKYWVQQDSIIKLADESVTSSAAVQPDNELLCPLLANSTYWIEIFIIYDAIQAADLLVGWTVPAGATVHWVTNGQDPSSTSTVWETLKRERSAANTETVGGPGAAAGTDAIMPGEGYVVTGGTAGSIRFQWGQGVSSGTPTVVRANSVLIVQKLTV